jgi:hypothetical protein
MPTPTGIASCHGKEVDRSLMLPVLNVLQVHPEAGDLWEKYINKILDRATIDGKGRPSVPTSRRHRCRLLPTYCGARLE